MSDKQNNSVCTVCGKQFRYDEEVGYARTICSRLCDGIVTGRLQVLNILGMQLEEIASHGTRQELAAGIERAKRDRDNLADGLGEILGEGK